MCVCVFFSSFFCVCVCACACACVCVCACVFMHVCLSMRVIAHDVCLSCNINHIIIIHICCYYYVWLIL